MFLCPFSDWDLRKVVNSPDRLAEFNDYATFFFEVLSKQIQVSHEQRKENGQGPVTQMVLLLDVKNYSYMQLINLGGKVLSPTMQVFECNQNSILQLLRKLCI